MQKSFSLFLFEVDDFENKGFSLFLFVFKKECFFISVKEFYDLDDDDDYVECYDREYVNY